MNTGRTWFRKGRIPWNKGKKISLRPKTGWDIICVVCSKKKYYQLNEHKKRKRIYCSPECYHKNSRKKKLRRYSSIHARIKSEWGRATQCENCGFLGRCDWANISGKYLLERIDWKSLCRKCHIAYDKQKGDLAYKNFRST